MVRLADFMLCTYLHSVELLIAANKSRNYQGTGADGDDKPVIEETLHAHTPITKNTHNFHGLRRVCVDDGSHFLSNIYSVRHAMPASTRIIAPPSVDVVGAVGGIYVRSHTAAQHCDMNDVDAAAAAAAAHRSTAQE